MAIIISQNHVEGNVDGKLPFTKYQYFNVRNTAWQFLIDHNISFLPISSASILIKLDIKVVPYNKLAPDAFLERRKDKSFTIIESENDISVCFNQSLNKKILNFTLAHELGHVILAHKRHELNYEQEANTFASRFLMPLIIIKELELTPKLISEVCNVSLTSAMFRYKRYLKILERDKFLTNPLEKEVLKQFEYFIRIYK